MKKKEKIFVNIGFNHYTCRFVCQFKQISKKKSTTQNLTFQCTVCSLSLFVKVVIQDVQRTTCSVSNLLNFSKLCLVATKSESVTRDMQGHRMALYIGHSKRVDMQTEATDIQGDTCLHEEPTRSLPWCPPKKTIET